MAKITITENVGGFEGLTLLQPIQFDDVRGSFFEAYNQRELKKEGFSVQFVQDNQSISHKGVLRGLHYQKKQPQGKLVRAVTGALYDVAVDLRKGSKTYGQYYGVVLSAENRLQLYIPKGFAHGFLALEDKTIFFAKVTDYHVEGDGRGILWKDANLNIAWPIEKLGCAPLLLSDKDKDYPLFDESVYIENYQ